MWLPISHHVENDVAPSDAFGEYLSMGLTPRKAIYLSHDIAASRCGVEAFRLMCL
jgi:hypothetical protein